MQMIEGVDYVVVNGRKGLTEIGRQKYIALARKQLAEEAKKYKPPYVKE